jgi:hypothetical protein
MIWIELVKESKNGYNLVKLKLESKDQLLARVWHSIEYILI